MDLLRYFERQQVKTKERPRLRAGDEVRVEMKVQEGEKTRLQTFDGIMLSIRGSGPSTTFMVRRETGGFGVERIFPLYSPLITNIEIVRRQKVRRAKLTYLRQAGRRRFKEDVLAMQRYVRESSFAQPTPRLRPAGKASEDKGEEEREEVKEKEKAEEEKMREEAQKEVEEETKQEPAGSESE